MVKPPRLFGNKKPNGPDLSRIRRTIEQATVPVASLPKSQNLPRQNRAKVYREASVVYASGYRRLGVVLDYSSTGVRLRFPTNERLPPEVTLYAGAVGVEGPARVVWQHNSEAGLALMIDKVA